MKKFNMKFENARLDDIFHMPQLTIKANDKVVGYLTPFRGYRFQVSLTEEGEWDLGSSPVMFMNEFKNLSDFYLKEHLRGQIGLCLNSHHKIMSNKSSLAQMCGFYDRKNKEEYEYVIADIKPPCYYGEEKPEIDKFLDLCVVWVKKLK